MQGHLLQPRGIIDLTFLITEKEGEYLVGFPAFWRWHIPQTWEPCPFFFSPVSPFRSEIVSPMPVPSLYFRSRYLVWFQSFTAGDCCLKRTHGSPPPFRHLGEISDLLLLEWVKILGCWHKMNLFFMWEGCEFGEYTWLSVMDWIVLYSNSYVIALNSQHLRKWLFWEMGL